MSTAVQVLNEAEYFSIEEAISATAKGRAFLRQRDKIGRAVGVDTIGQIVSGLKDWIAGDDGPDRESLELIRRELGSIRAHIDQVKAEISTLASEEQSNNRFRSATAELYEIVTSTARATEDILTAAEAIKEITDALPAEHSPKRETVGKHCLNIFQACSFQDITGQRIAKVVKTLDYVEERINSMLSIGGHAAAANGVPAAPVNGAAPAAPRPAAKPAAPPRADEHLLHGPQLPGAGLNQNDIDQLLNGATAQPAAAAAPVNAEPLGQNAIDSLFA